MLRAPVLLIEVAKKGAFTKKALGEKGADGRGWGWGLLSPLRLLLSPDLAAALRRGARLQHERCIKGKVLMPAYRKHNALEVHCTASRKASRAAQRSHAPNAAERSRVPCGVHLTQPVLYAVPVGACASRHLSHMSCTCLFANAILPGASLLSGLRFR